MKEQCDAKVLEQLNANCEKVHRMDNIVAAGRRRSRGGWGGFLGGNSLFEYLIIFLGSFVCLLLIAFCVYLIEWFCPNGCCTTDDGV